MKKILLLFLCLLITSPALAFNKFMLKLQKKFKNSELIKIESYRAFDFYSIQEGWHKNSPSKFDALIIYPKGEGPFPLVMISHSSWGPEEYISKWMVFHKRQAKKLQKKGIGSSILSLVEEKLYKLGCPKINLFVRNTNIKVKAFYKTNNYEMQDSQIYGKRLISDN